MSQSQPGPPNRAQASTAALELATKAWPLMALDPPRSLPWDRWMTLPPSASYAFGQRDNVRSGKWAD